MDLVVNPKVGDNSISQKLKMWKLTPSQFEEKYKRLKNKGLNSDEVLEKRELTPKLTPKNPNEYNGEVIDNQSVKSKNTNTKKLFIESYGCAMNFSDSEIVASILSKEGFNTTQILEEADLVLVNTCSIRDKAADRQRIQQVLTNLVVNSIKYGHQNGTTEISVEDLNSDKLIVRVTDNGEGVESNHLTRLFERFYRVDKSGSRQEGGSGLGLSIVKHIIEAHGEKIYVESKFGIGSEFSFTLQKQKQ